MIESRLRVILAEKYLTISKVSADTGISRTTLTALSKNHCKGIHINTLNTLCMYLNVLPSDLLASTKGGGQIARP